MSKNDFIRELASMVMVNHKDVKEKGVGLFLSGYWLTPSQCYDLADLIEEVNNEDYGEGNWKFYKDAVLILRNHSFQNQSEF